MCGDLLFLSRKKIQEGDSKARKRSSGVIMGTAEVTVKVLQLEFRSYTAKEWSKLFCHNTNQLFVLWTQGEEVYPVVRWQHCLSTSSFLWTNTTAQRENVFLNESCLWQLMCGDRHCHNRPETLSPKFLPFPLSYPIEFLAEKTHSKERKSCLLETPPSNPTGDIWSSDEASDSQLPSHAF